MRQAWKTILPALSQEHSVLTYSRPGYGASPMVHTPRDGKHIVAELRVLLQKLNLSPPYILVGHSIGGLYMQLFARQHPEDVAALVLIDPTHPQQFIGLGAIEHRPWWFRGLFELFLRIRGGKEELAAAVQTGAQVLATPWHPSCPVFVLHAKPSVHPRTQRTSALDQFSLDKKRDFLNLYPGCHLTWIDSGHNIQHEHPEAVLAVLHTAISSRPIQAAPT